MMAFWALVKKDLLLYKRNRRAWLLHLIMPVLLAAFFGYITGGVGKQGIAKINIALVNQDQHPLSEKIKAALLRDENLTIEQLSLEQAKEKVSKAKLKLLIVIPQGFAEQAQQAFFGQAEKAELQCFYDPSDTIALTMVNGLLTQHVMEQVSQEVFGAQGEQSFLGKSLKQLEQSDLSQERNRHLRDLLSQLQVVQADDKAQGKANLQGLSSPFKVVQHEVVAGAAAKESRYNGYAHSFAGMSVQFLLFMAIDAGITILMLQRQGIWNRLIAAPINFSWIILARAVSCALIALFLLCVIFGIGSLLFGVQIRGNLFAFFLLCLVFSLMTASFGLVIAAFGKTPEAARGIATFATLIMVMLSGAWMPAFLFPAWLQQLTLLIPLRWAVDGFDAMTWRGLGWAEAGPAILVQAGFTILFAALALWRFQQQRSHK